MHDGYFAIQRHLEVSDHLLTHGQAFDLHQNLVGEFSQNESIEDVTAFAENQIGLLSNSLIYHRFQVAFQSPDNSNI